MNKVCIISGIKNLLERNYKLSSDLYDIEAMVDSELCFSDNWKHIKQTLNLPICSCCGRYLK